MKMLRRQIGSPFRALTILGLVAFLLANAGLLIVGLRNGNDDQSGNGGFGVVVFFAVLVLMARRFQRSAPAGDAEWALARRFTAGPIRLIVLGSLGFLVVTSFGLFAAAVAQGETAGIINGSIGTVLMAFLLVQTGKALGVADADLAAEREQYAAGTAPRRPLWQYPLVVYRVTKGNLFRRYVASVVIAFLLASVAGTGYLITTRDPQLLVFPPAAVLMTLLLVTVVGKFAADDERARGEPNR